MRIKEEVSVETLKHYGRYLGDFYTEPNGEVHSTVFQKDGRIHVYYSLATGISLDGSQGRRLTDSWRTEILQFIYDEGLNEHNVPIELILHHRGSSLLAK